MANKEVYVNKAYNTEMAADAIFILDVQEAADKNDYLPLNKLRVANQSSEKIFIYLDTLPVSTASPDYVLGADRILDEGFEEGVQFNTVYVVNKGTGTISANDIAIRVAKVEEVN